MVKVVVVTGTPVWLASLAGADQWLHYTEKAGYVTRLSDDFPALILVDSRDPDWRYWTTTPKTSPATRRIPVIVVHDQSEADHRQQALSAGADDVINVAELIRDPQAILRHYARQIDPTGLERLECDCQLALPDLAQQGIARFNEQDYYEQHDLLEALWVETEGPIRDLYRAILQIGIAYYQILEGNQRGALKMLLRSTQWLMILPDQCQGVDVAQLRADALRVRAELERVTDLAEFDRSLLRPVVLIQA